MDRAKENFACQHEPDNSDPRANRSPCELCNESLRSTGCNPVWIYAHLRNRTVRVESLRVGSHFLSAQNGRFVIVRREPFGSAGDVMHVQSLDDGSKTMFAGCADVLQLRKNQPEPRYDDVFANGLVWLETNG